MSDFLQQSPIAGPAKMEEQYILKGLNPSFETPGFHPDTTTSYRTGFNRDENATDWNFLQALVVEGQNRLSEIEQWATEAGKNEQKAREEACHVNSQGFTAFMMAVKGARKGVPETVRVLAPFSNTRHQDNQGQNALMIAVEHFNEELVRFLIPLSDVKQVDRKGHSALIVAVTPGWAYCINSEIVKLLIPHSDVNLMVEDEFQKYEIDQANAVMLAAKKNCLESITALAPLSDETSQKHAFAYLVRKASENSNESHLARYKPCVRLLFTLALKNRWIPELRRSFQSCAVLFAEIAIEMYNSPPSKQQL